MSHTAVALLAVVVTYLVQSSVEPDPIQPEATDPVRRTPVREEGAGGFPQTSKVRATEKTQDEEQIEVFDWSSFNEATELSQRASQHFQTFELKNVEFSGVFDDAESSGVFHKFRKPSAAEIEASIDRFMELDSKSGDTQSREFVRRLALQFFDYPQQYRYVTVISSKEPDAPLLPTLLIRESDLDLSEDELETHDGSGFSVSNAADLGLGDNLLKRFGHLFSFGD